jgi:acyl carrier protein
MSAVTDEVVRTTIADLVGADPGEVTADVRLESLVADSFALVELAIALQEELDVVITQDDLREVTTVGQICDVFRAASGRSHDG